MQLVIVESPVKARTIQKFLGPGYRTASSFGHIRDLPKGELGVDTENNFTPKYVIPTKARKTVKLLKEETKKAQMVLLSTDPDREGEAISWHLAQVLGLDKNPESYQRITFHEITKSAIEEALTNPRKIDLNLVDAQQARRILDRIVGYKLSPFLWKKLSRGLSAGRVQSIAVRLVVEREREIQNFVAQEYWTIEALLKKIQNLKRKSQNDAETKTKEEFVAVLVKIGEKIIPKLGIKNKNEAEKIVKDLEGAQYQIIKVEKKATKRNPLPPFTTSILQQEAWRRFHFPSKLTMQIAQQLYETGKITYHRTDSLNLSNLSLFAAKKLIIGQFGKEYWPGFLRKYKAKGRAQEAHEAIRPTDPFKDPSSIAKTMDGKTIFAKDSTVKLYELIWRRFIACQMSQAIFNLTTVDITAKNYTFRASGQILKFDGFLKVYPLKFEENELPALENNEALQLKELIPSQHFTEPPARYTEATLIKALEEQGIGRPSTYAPTISTIQERNYIEKNEEKRFQPTEIGFSVNDLLVEHFPKIVDIKFTAKMENDLDEIAQGKKKWVNVLGAFYSDFAENLSHKYEEVTKKTMIEETEKKCPKCGINLVIRFGKFGKFIACPRFPDCKYTETLEKNPLGIKCPKCGAGNVVERRTKTKKIFFGCSIWPKCDFASWDRPTGELCPKCSSLLIETKRKQIKCSNKACDYSQIKPKKAKEIVFDKSGKIDNLEI